MQTPDIHGRGQATAHEDAAPVAGTTGVSVSRKGKQEVITAQRVRDLLQYDAQTGQFFWLANRAPNKAGDVAGTHHSLGYTVITIDFRPCYAHRLAWLWVYGEWPSGPLDHINGDKKDNRLANLRLTTARKNQQNLKKHREGKLVGCSYNKLQRRWQACISVNRKRVSLGYYDTEEEAHQAYVRACRELTQ